jgi:hypothetical protein
MHMPVAVGVLAAKVQIEQIKPVPHLPRVGNAIARRAQVRV